MAYNGLGDRLQQTLDSVTTSYTLDLAGGLTQVLSDGTNTYLYGASRISQQAGSATEYFLGDALGSVRQMADAAGEITLARAYEPFGEVLNSAGSGVSSYGFTGEWTDGTGLVNLRARYYAPYLNQFIQPDTIVPDSRSPQNWNRYAYVRNNPINFTDPSGKTWIGQTNSDLSACVSSDVLRGVEYSVRMDVCKMIPELEEAGFYEDMPDQDHITGGYRNPKLAHTLSTAYHIIHDLITVEDVKQTPIDQDGTTWYRKEWDYLYPDCNGKNLIMAWLLNKAIKQNASAQVPPEYNIYVVWFSVYFVRSPAYALEGYQPGNARRLPNSDNPPISKHVLRVAVDIGNGYIGPTEGWVPAIDTIARKYHLIRPYNKLLIDYANIEITELWHFEHQ